MASSITHIRGVPDWDWPAKPHARLEARAKETAGRPFTPSVVWLAFALRTEAEHEIAEFLRTAAGR